MADRGASTKCLILAPLGRDAAVAKTILREAQLQAHICVDAADLAVELESGPDVAIVTEEALQEGAAERVAKWVASQPPWSDLPFVVLTKHGGGLERNPTAGELTEALGNVTFLERPFHPTTLVSVVRAAIRSRGRQYECRRLNEQLETRVEERTHELARANEQLLSQIQERERVESTLRQMQRLEAVGQLTSGVAHDFNNLLTVVLGNISFVEREVRSAGLDGKLLQRLQYMRSAAERGARLTDQLLTFSRRQRLEPKPVDLNTAISGMSELLQSTIGGRVRITTRLQDGVSAALVDPTQLELAVLNLAINARDAMDVGGSLTIETRNVTVGAPERPEEPSAGEYVCVIVSDHGTGMPPDIRAKVFEPFFTTKDVGKGSGLGLSQVLGFAKQSGGGVRLDTRVGQGTSVFVYLPRAGAAAAEAEPRNTGKSAGSDSDGRILVVDDDLAVLDVTATMLRGWGYEVVEATCGANALGELDRRDVALVITDFAMPGMNGAEFARLVRARWPDLPVLFVTGFADEAAALVEGKVIRKPFAETELSERVQEALARRTVSARRGRLTVVS